MSRVLFWIVRWVPLGPLGPWVVGLALRRRPHQVQEVDREWAQEEWRG